MTQGGDQSSERLPARGHWWEGGVSPSGWTVKLASWMFQKATPWDAGPGHPGQRAKREAAGGWSKVGAHEARGHWLLARARDIPCSVTFLLRCFLKQVGNFRPRRKWGLGASCNDPAGHRRGVSLVWP